MVPPLYSMGIDCPLPLGMPSAVCFVWQRVGTLYLFDHGTFIRIHVKIDIQGILDVGMVVKLKLKKLPCIITVTSKILLLPTVKGIGC